MVFALLFLLVLNVAMPLAAQPAVYQAPERADVLVVGGSPAGIAAAIAAARQGRSVVLVEPRPFLGPWGYCAEPDQAVDGSRSSHHRRNR